MTEYKLPIRGSFGSKDLETSLHLVCEMFFLPPSVDQSLELDSNVIKIVNYEEEMRLILYDSFRISKVKETCHRIQT